MLTLLLLLVAGLAPNPAALLARLESPQYAVRQAAEGALRRQMNWPLALRIEGQLSHLGAEGRARAWRLIAAYYATPFDARRIPRIDSLNWGPMGWPDDSTAGYYCRGHDFDLLPGTAGCDQQYRVATWLLLGEMHSWRLPPGVTRGVLAAMSARTAAWELEESERRRMPCGR